MHGGYGPQDFVMVIGALSAVLLAAVAAGEKLVDWIYERTEPRVVEPSADDDCGTAA